MGLGIYLHGFALDCALGSTPDEIACNLEALRAPGLTERTDLLLQGSVFVGQATAEGAALPPELAAYDSRNNRLLGAVLDELDAEIKGLIARYGPTRVAAVTGTSTSGLDEADKIVSSRAQGSDYAPYRYNQQEIGDCAAYLKARYALQGPCYTVSTACSSTTRALISAVRLIKSAQCDAVLAGGADTLCRMPLNGFDSLQLVSRTPCRPFTRDRAGITIGEAAGAALLSKERAALEILGYGESSDAYHISSPHPEGSGAKRAMEMALDMAGLNPEDIGYVNLHGTGSKLNDEVEAQVMHELFGTQVPCSSTKYLTGHTLGASGICEAVLCALILKRSLSLPPQLCDSSPLDESLPECGLITERTRLKRPIIMSNAFAFGGNNASIIIGLHQEESA